VRMATHTVNYAFRPCRAKWATLDVDCNWAWQSLTARSRERTEAEAEAEAETIAEALVNRRAGASCSSYQLMSLLGSGL